MSSSGATTGDVAPLKYPAPGEAWAIDVVNFRRNNTPSPTTFIP
jgi:hypothetical protein